MKQKFINLVLVLSILSFSIVSSNSLAVGFIAEPGALPPNVISQDIPISRVEQSASSIPLVPIDSNSFNAEETEASASSIANACEAVQDYDKGSLLVLLKETPQAIKGGAIPGESYNTSSNVELPIGHSSANLFDVSSNPNLEVAASFRSLTESEATEIRDNFNSLVQASGLARTITVKFPQVSTCQAMNEMINLYLANPRVESVFLNSISKVQALRDGTPNDNLFSTSRHLLHIRANSVWSMATGSGVKVGVIDQTIHPFHPDLNIWVNQVEASGRLGVDDDYNSCVDDVYLCNSDRRNQSLLLPLDPAYDSHGTHVSGIIAAKADNSIGSLGVAPLAQVVPATAVYLSDAEVIFAINNLLRKNVSIINLSFGGFTNNVNQWKNHPLYLTIQAAIRAGVVVVVAAGNDNRYVGHLTYAGPVDQFSVIPGVISVGSVNSSNQKSSFSNFGANVDISAPGENVISTTVAYDQNLSAQFGFDTLSGTSMAAPMVAGAFALLKSFDNQLTADMMTTAILATASMLPGQNVGKLLNIEAAIDYVKRYYQLLDISIISPSINQVVHTPRPLLKWSPAGGDTRSFNYIVTLTNLDTGVRVLRTEITPGLYSALNEYQVPNDLPDARYSLEVVAKHRVVSGRQKSASRTFTLRRQILVTDLVGSLQLSNGSLRFNQSRTRREKYLYNPVTRITYFILPDGNVHQHGSTSTLPIGRLSSIHYTDINRMLSVKLNDAQLIAAHGYDPDCSGNVNFNFSRARFEKKFYGRFGATNMNSYIAPDGTVTVDGQTVPVMKLSSSYYVEPTAFSLITETPDQFFRLMNKLDLQLASYKSNFDFNLSRRYNEKWFAGKRRPGETVTPRYYILSDGRVYYFRGNLTNIVYGDVLVARVNTSYYTNPSTMVHTNM